MESRTNRIGQVDEDRTIERLLREGEQAHRAQRLAQAQASFQSVIDIEPRQAFAWRGLAMLAWQSGALDRAVALLAKSVECAPGEAVLRWQYGCALQKSERYAEAAAQFEAACRSSPEVAQYWEDLGVAQQALGETLEAARAYGRAVELEPNLSRRLKQATLVSPIPASHEAIVEERARIDARLDALLDAPGRSDEDPTGMALWPNFHWAYHGLPDRGLQTKAAEVYRHLFPSLDYVAEHCRSSHRAPGRIRVGLISQFFHNHSIGRTSRGFFAGLSRDAFEVTALLVAPVVDDDYSRFIRECAEHSVEVPRALPEARKVIEERRLDVLFYQDIGMDPFTYFLAFSRLAPIQCVSFGHPDTTGIPTMDYFISNDLYESSAAQSDYSERLFLLHDLGTLAYYYRPARADLRTSRSRFGVAGDAHLYVCPQNLFKIHPDMDEIFAGILRHDALGTIAMVQGRIGHWTELLRRRWSSSIPDVMDRIVFLPRLDSDAFAELIAASDVMLDTLHFNGMNTSLEAFAAGTPVVTLPGSLQRGRHTQAMYRKMGLGECVARDEQDYIDRAVTIASVASYRTSLRGAIVERSAALFEDIAVVREFERFFRESVREKIGELA